MSPDTIKPEDLAKKALSPKKIDLDKILEDTRKRTETELKNKNIEEEDLDILLNSLRRQKLQVQGLEVDPEIMREKTKETKRENIQKVLKTIEEQIRMVEEKRKKIASKKAENNQEREETSIPVNVVKKEPETPATPTMDVIEKKPVTQSDIDRLVNLMGKLGEYVDPNSIFQLTEDDPSGEAIKNAIKEREKRLVELEGRLKKPEDSEAKKENTGDEPTVEIEDDLGAEWNKMKKEREEAAISLKENRPELKVEESQPKEDKPEFKADEGIEKMEGKENRIKEINNEMAKIEENIQVLISEMDKTGKEKKTLDPNDEKQKKRIDILTEVNDGKQRRIMNMISDKEKLQVEKRKILKEIKELEKTQKQEDGFEIKVLETKGNMGDVSDVVEEKPNENKTEVGIIDDEEEYNRKFDEEWNRIAQAKKQTTSEVSQGEEKQENLEKATEVTEAKNEQKDKKEIPFDEDLFYRSLKMIIEQGEKAKTERKRIQERIEEESNKINELKEKLKSETNEKEKKRLEKEIKDLEMHNGNRRKAVSDLTKRIDSVEARRKVIMDLLKNEVVKQDERAQEENKDELNKTNRSGGKVFNTPEEIAEFEKDWLAKNQETSPEEPLTSEPKETFIPISTRAQEMIELVEKQRLERRVDERIRDAIAGDRSCRGVWAGMARIGRSISLRTQNLFNIGRARRIREEIQNEIEMIESTERRYIAELFRDINDVFYWDTAEGEALRRDREMFREILGNRGTFDRMVNHPTARRILDHPIAGNLTLGVILVGGSTLATKSILRMGVKALYGVGFGSGAIAGGALGGFIEHRKAQEAEYDAQRWAEELSEFSVQDPNERRRVEDLVNDMEQRIRDMRVIRGNESSALSLMYVIREKRLEIRNADRVQESGETVENITGSLENRNENDSENPVLDGERARIFDEILQRKNTEIRQRTVRGILVGATIGGVAGAVASYFEHARDIAGGGAGEIKPMINNIVNENSIPKSIEAPLMQDPEVMRGMLDEFNFVASTSSGEGTEVVAGKALHDYILNFNSLSDNGDIVITKAQFGAIRALMSQEMNPSYMGISQPGELFSWSGADMHRIIEQVQQMSPEELNFYERNISENTWSIFDPSRSDQLLGGDLNGFADEMLQIKSNNEWGAIFNHNNPELRGDLYPMERPFGPFGQEALENSRSAVGIEEDIAPGGVEEIIPSTSEEILPPIDQGTPLGGEEIVPRSPDTDGVIRRGGEEILPRTSENLSGDTAEDVAANNGLSLEDQRSYELSALEDGRVPEGAISDIKRLMANLENPNESGVITSDPYIYEFAKQRGLSGFEAGSLANADPEERGAIIEAVAKAAKGILTPEYIAQWKEKWSVA
uniref:Uncharacterized protein n=1 Tax=candidate division CPR3 bacterium TaxID=2268181 RepID=A0A7C4M094_UNCC3